MYPILLDDVMKRCRERRVSKAQDATRQDHSGIVDSHLKTTPRLKTIQEMTHPIYSSHSIAFIQPNKGIP